MPLGELIGSVSERGALATPGHLPLRRPCLTTHSGRIIHRDGRALLTRRQQPQTPREGPHRRLQGARGVHLPPPWSRPCRGPECGDSGEVAPQTSTSGQERRSFEGGQGSLHTCLEELPENRGPATPGRGPEGSVGASLNTKAKRPVRDADDLRTSFFSEPRCPRPPSASTLGPALPTEVLMTDPGLEPGQDPMPLSYISPHAIPVSQVWLILTWKRAWSLDVLLGCPRMQISLRAECPGRRAPRSLDVVVIAVGAQP